MRKSFLNGDLKIEHNDIYERQIHLNCEGCK